MPWKTTPHTTSTTPNLSTTTLHGSQKYIKVARIITTPKQLYLNFSACSSHLFNHFLTTSNIIKIKLTLIYQVPWLVSVGISCNKYAKIAFLIVILKFILSFVYLDKVCRKISALQNLHLEIVVSSFRVSSRKMSFLYIWE